MNSVRQTFRLVPALAGLILATEILPADPEPSPPPPTFVRDILPILSKAGCNAGTCHAKAEGQNGFKLSVFAYDPESDYREIVQESRGRRVFPASPEHSLLLLKPTLTVPHEGGQRLERGTESYRTLVAWIQSGMPYQRAEDPALTSVDVVPAQSSYRQGEHTSLKVLAIYGDGTKRDVTHLAEFNSTDREIVSVDGQGLVTAGAGHGEAAIVARFMGLVAVSKATIPAGRLLPDAAYTGLPVQTFIDQLAYERFRSLGLLPSKPCTDAEFLRRSSLDAIGTLPSVEETKAFLENPSPNKRNAWIDQILEHPAYADHWAVKWGDLLRPNPSRVGVKSVYLLDQWLRAAFRQNKPYDQFVREILTAQGNTHRDGPTVVFRDRREPADLTTLVSQIFLGTRLECARCHHHPNERWSQDDFYQLAAYFAEVKHKGTGISPPISGGAESVFHQPGGEVKHPVSGKVMHPKPPGGDGPDMATGQDPREPLADWVTGRDNPFFARAIVNRIWGELMGRGFVDPVDDFRASNPPVHEPLLDAIANDFVSHGYDLKHLIRTIMRSNLYQLSAEPNETNVGDTRHFSRAYHRRLPAEVLLDAVALATGVPEDFQGLPSKSRAIETWNHKLDSQFMDAFGRPNSSAECPCERDAQSSVVQALHLMNSTELQAKIADKGGRAARLAAGERREADIVTELYLATFNRYPTPEEQTLAARAFAAEGTQRQWAIEDILWALLNSAEFVFNH